MAEATTAKKAPEPSAAAADDSSLVVLDIGKKQRKKRIRQLRKGHGRLFDKVKDLLDDMREEGTIAANAQPVVIVVRERANAKFPFRMR